jgi:sugar phosphate isomerase/epimerase
MNDWPVGLSTGCFHHKKISDCLEHIGSGGFHLIEVCSLPSHLNYRDEPTVRSVAEQMQNLGIEAYSFHAPFADHIDITSLDEGVRQRSVAEVLSAAHAASILKVRHFVIHPGPEHAGQPHGEERERRLYNVARSLSEVAVRCQELGVLCVLENKLPHLMFGNVPDMMWILGAMTTTQVGVCLDTGHAFLAGVISTVVPKLGHYLRVIHASDNHGRYDDHLPPGKGSIGWSDILQQLRHAHFDGTIILEIAGRGEDAEIMKAAREAAGFLREQERLLNLAAS